MQTAEEMQAAGIKREVKMMALAHLGELTSDLGLVLVRDNELALAEVLAGTVMAIRQRCEELNAENLAAYETFHAAATEVQTLEAMLAAGGEEVCAACTDPEAEELAMDARAERDAWRRENREG